MKFNKKIDFWKKANIKANKIFYNEKVNIKCESCKEEEATRFCEATISSEYDMKTHKIIQRICEKKICGKCIQNNRHCRDCSSLLYQKQEYSRRKMEKFLNKYNL